MDGFDFDRLPSSEADHRQGVFFQTLHRIERLERKIRRLARAGEVVPDELRKRLAELYRQADQEGLEDIWD